MAAVEPTSALRQYSTPDGGRNDQFDYSDPYDDAAGYQQPITPAPYKAPSEFNYTSNPSAFNTTENASSWYDPFSFGNYGQDANSATLKSGYDPLTGKYSDSKFNIDQKQLLQQSEIDKNNAIMNNQGTSWNDWANIGLGTVGTAMEIGMYGDKKDFLSGSVDALEQSTANSQEAHDTKMANNASYGSAFSKA